MKRRSSLITLIIILFLGAIGCEKPNRVATHQTSAAKNSEQSQAEQNFDLTTHPTTLLHQALDTLSPEHIDTAGPLSIEFSSQIKSAALMFGAPNNMGGEQIRLRVIFEMDAKKIADFCFKTQVHDLKSVQKFVPLKPYRCQGVRNEIKDLKLLTDATGHVLAKAACLDEECRGLVAVVTKSYRGQNADRDDEGHWAAISLANEAQDRMEIAASTSPGTLLSAADYKQTLLERLQAPGNKVESPVASDALVSWLAKCRQDMASHANCETFILKFEDVVRERQHKLFDQCLSKPLSSAHCAEVLDHSSLEGVSYAKTLKAFCSSDRVDIEYRDRCAQAMHTAANTQTPSHEPNDRPNDQPDHQPDHEQAEEQVVQDSAPRPGSGSQLPRVGHGTAEAHEHGGREFDQGSEPDENQEGSGIGRTGEDDTNSDHDPEAEPQDPPEDDEASRTSLSRGRAHRVGRTRR